MKKIAADILIFGGGIAGLWLLNRLSHQGLSVLLCETNTLGGGQTFCSQGIIHGGMKYALQGVFSKEMQGMADIPSIWKKCLNGTGEIDLRDVPILSPKQYLWGPNALTSKFAGFLASAALSSKVDSLAKEFYPEIFQHPEFKGSVFALDELVLDVPKLVKTLSQSNHIIKIDSLFENGFHFDVSGNLISINTLINEEPVSLKAQQFIFTAGAGNEIIIHQLKQKELAMQRRPLHMVLAKMKSKHKLYAHCLGLGSRPRMTITTHAAQDGALVWYMGGSIAEEGISLNEDDQIKATKKELQTLFPWLSFANASFASFIIDRAEPYQANGLKPETSYLKTIKNMTIAWPTKLALAPKLAEEILQKINRFDLMTQFPVPDINNLPKPAIATPVWENAFCKEQI